MNFFKKKTLNDILKIENQEEKINEIYKYLSRKCHYGEKVDQLSDEEKTLYDVMDFEAEMNDGGLEQFLYSEASDDIERTCQSLKSLNLESIAELLQDVKELFPGGLVPSIQSERARILELMLNDGPIFQEFDDRYSRLDIHLSDHYIVYINEKMMKNKF